MKSSLTKGFASVIMALVVGALAVVSGAIIESVLHPASLQTPIPEKVVVQKKIAQAPKTTPKVASNSDGKVGAVNITGGGTYRLQSSISSSQATIRLSSFKEPTSNIPYTMSYLNSTIEYGTLDPQTTHSEFISFTGITQNTDGTATLSGVTRGLSRSPGSGGCVASTTLATTHSGQSIFILSNSPCFYSEYAVKKNDETITGYWTVPTPLSNGNPATKAYVDSLVSGGSVSNSAVTVAGTAGETISTGQFLYLKQSDGRWYKAATTIAEASSTMLGIAQGAGTSGNAITNGVLIQGLDTNQSGLTASSMYFLSATAGTPQTSTTTRLLGQARNTTSIYFNPSLVNANILNTANTFTASTTFTGPVTLATTTINTYIPQGTMSTTTTVNGTTMTLTNIPANDLLRIIINASTTNSAASTGFTVTFNGDSGSNYAFVGQNLSQGSVTFASSLNPLPLFTSATGQMYTTIDVLNQSSSIKYMNLQSIAVAYPGFVGFATSTSAIYRGSSRITSVTVTSASANTLAAGSWIKAVTQTSP